MPSFKSIGLFVDISNIFYCIGKKYGNRKLDYSKYYTSIVGEDVMYRARAYGVQMGCESIKFITALKHIGFETQYKIPRLQTTEITFAEGANLVIAPHMLHATHQQRRTSWNVGISMDIVRMIEKLDVVVLGSSDADLSSLVEYIKERGVQCRIAACGISKELKSVADSYCEIEENLLVTTKG